MSNRLFYGALLTLSALFFAGVFGYQNGWFARSITVDVAWDQRDKQVYPLEPSVEEIQRDGLVKIGDVYRKKTDLEKHDSLEIPRKNGKSIGEKIGFPPVIDPNENESVKSLVEARKNPEKFPERLTSMIMPKPFDKDVYEKNPEAYLAVTEPGRIYLDLPAGPDVPVLKRHSPVFQPIVQGESITLQVKGEPNMPVTYHSPYPVAFENKLNTITVKADKNGLAKVNLKTDKGSYGLVNVFVASPVSSNRVKFVLDVSLSL